MSWGTRRKAALTEPRWKKQLTRKAGDVGNRVGEVELLAGLEAFALVVVEDRVDDLARLLTGKDVEALHVHDLALVAHRRRHPRRDVDVGGPALDHAAKHLCEVDGHGDLDRPLRRIPEV